MPDPAAYVSVAERDPELFDLPLIRRQTGTRAFVERQWLTDEIGRCLADQGCRIVLVTGDPGTGKTTLAAWLADQHPGWLRYFIRRSGEIEGSRERRHTGGLASFLTVIGLQLAAVHPEAFPSLQEILDLHGEAQARTVRQGAQARAVWIHRLVIHPFRRLIVRMSLDVAEVEGQVTGVEIDEFVLTATEQPEVLAEPALYEPARRLADRDQQVVVLLDGLDELEFRTAASDVGQWLTGEPALPDNVRFVVTSRTEDQRLSALRRAHQDTIRTLHIEPACDDVADDIRRSARKLAADPGIGGLLAAHLIHPDRFERAMADRAGGNFQYLGFLGRVLAEAAQAQAAGEPLAAADLDWLDDIMLLPSGLDRLYGLFLDRVRDNVARTFARRQWAELHRPVLGLLSVARAALSAGQLDVLGDLADPDEPTWLALTALRQFLVLGPRGYQLYHPSVADFLHQSDAGAHHCPPLDYHALIAATAIKHHHEAGSWRHADPYLRAYLARHAAESGRLDELVEDPRYLVAADPAGLLEVSGALRRAAPIGGLYRQVVPALRESGEAAALAHLELYARQGGQREFAGRVAAMRGEGPWTLAWTHWRQSGPIQLLGWHDAEVAAVVTARAGGSSMAVTGGQDGRLRIWNLTTGLPDGQLIHQPQPRRPHGIAEAMATDGRAESHRVTALATSELNSGESMLVSGSRGGTVRVWNLDAREALGQPLAGIESAGEVIGVGSGLGLLPVVCRVGADIRVWDLAELAPAGPPISAEDAETAAVCRTGDRARLLVAAGSSTGPGNAHARAWDAVTGDPIGPPLRLEGGGWVTAITLGEAAGKLVVAVGDGAGGVQAWDAQTGDRLDWPMIGDDQRVTAIAVGTVDDRAILATGDDAGQARLWDLAASSPLGPPISLCPGGEVTALGIDGVILTTAGRQQVSNKQPRSVVQGWLLSLDDPAQPLERLSADMADLPTGEKVLGVAVSQLGEESLYLTGRTDERRVRLWEFFTGRPVGGDGVALLGECEPVRAVAAANVRHRPLAAAGIGNAVRVWDVGTGKQACPKLDAGGQVVSLAITTLRDEPVIVAGTWRDGIRVWDLASGEAAGAGHIAEAGYLEAMTVGAIDGKPVVLAGGGDNTGGGPSVRAYDLETGGVARRYPIPATPLALALVGYHGSCLIVSGASDRLLRVWDAAEDGAHPGLHEAASGPVSIPDHLGVFAVTAHGDRLHAVCSGKSGAVRLVDLPDVARAAPGTHRPTAQDGRAGDAWDAAAVLGVAVTELGDQPVVVCARGDGQVLVLDLASGEPAARAPSVPKVSRRRFGGIATATLEGRPVAVAAAKSLSGWYLDDGHPLAVPVDLPERARITAIATGAPGGRPVLGAADGDHQVHLADLQAGQPLRPAFTGLSAGVSALCLADLRGRPVVVYSWSGQVRARYADPADEARLIEAEYAGRRDFDRQQETPPAQPRLAPLFKAALNRSGTGTDALAAGVLHGTAVALSSRDDGAIDVFTIDTALPVGEPLTGHDGAIAALAFADLGGRPVAASGGYDGTVRFWDLTDASQITAVRTLTGLTAVALHPPDYCVIATEKGLIAARIDLRALAPGRPCALLPRDVRGLRRCPVHAEHVQVRRVGSAQVTRFCVKGFQAGNSQYRQLEYAGGHCYVLADRLVLASADQPEWNLAGLEIGLHPLHSERVDVPHAYEYDGGHFRITLDDASSHRSLCCYRRAEADQLYELINARQQIESR